MRKGIQKSQSNKSAAWLVAGAGLGTVAAVAYGLWMRHRKGHAGLSVEDVLDKCRDAASLLEQSIKGVESPVSNGAHVR